MNANYKSCNRQWKRKKPSCCKTKKHNKKIESKLQELMLRAYPVSFDNINDEHWALGKKN